MLLIDTTIVQVALPGIATSLHAYVPLCVIAVVLVVAYLAPDRAATGRRIDLAGGGDVHGRSHSFDVRAHPHQGPERHSGCAKALRTAPCVGFRGMREESAGADPSHSDLHLLRTRSRMPERIVVVGASVAGGGERRWPCADRGSRASSSSSVTKPGCPTTSRRFRSSSWRGSGTSGGSPCWTSAPPVPLASTCGWERQPSD